MDRENNVVKKAMTPNAQKAYFPKMLEGNPKGFDCVFITYSQVNKEGEQQKFLRNLLANRNAMLVMDEAHNASGAESNTGAYFQGLLKHENLKGAMFLSATYAKRPDNMILFALRNELGKIFNGDQLVKVIKKGGLALQQIISQGLAQAGQLIRRERDFTGVKMNIGEAIRTTADVKRQYDEVAGGDGGHCAVQRRDCGPVQGGEEACGAQGGRVDAREQLFEHGSQLHRSAAVCDEAGRGGG